MKAIALTEYGGPEVLHAVELDDPHAGEGEVRVRVHAAALNPADVMLREGLLAGIYEDLPLPYVPGMDLSGVIDEIGSGVDPALGLSVGDTVVGIVDNTGDYGAYSEYVALPAASVTAAPAGASFAEAASFLMNALTARNALDTLDLEPGATVLVTGAAGAVGGYAVPLAHAEGLRVIALAGEEDREAVLTAGADVFVPRGERAIAQIREAAPGGVDAVIDAATLYDGITAAVRDGGTLIDVRFWDADPGRGIEIAHVNVRQRAEDTAAITALREQVESGLLELRVSEVFPAADAVAAHRRLDAGHLRGRVILDFSDALD